MCVRVVARTALCVCLRVCVCVYIRENGPKNHRVLLLLLLRLLLLPLPLPQLARAGSSSRVCTCVYVNSSVLLLSCSFSFDYYCFCLATRWLLYMVFAAVRMQSQKSLHLNAHFPLRHPKTKRKTSDDRIVRSFVVQNKLNIHCTAWAHLIHLICMLVHIAIYGHKCVLLGSFCFSSQKLIKKTSKADNFRARIRLKRLFGKCWWKSVHMLLLLALLLLLCFVVVIAVLLQEESHTHTQFTTEKINKL